MDPSNPSLRTSTTIGASISNHSSGCSNTSSNDADDDSYVQAKGGATGYVNSIYDYSTTNGFNHVRYPIYDRAKHATTTDLGQDEEEAVYNPNDVLASQPETIDFAVSNSSLSLSDSPRLLSLIDKEETSNEITMVNPTKEKLQDLPIHLPISAPHQSNPGRHGSNKNSSDSSYSESNNTTTNQTLQDMEAGFKSRERIISDKKPSILSENLVNACPLRPKTLNNATNFARSSSRHHYPVDNQPMMLLMERRAMASRLGAMRALPPRMTCTKRQSQEPALRIPPIPTGSFNSHSVWSSTRSFQSNNDDISAIAPLPPQRFVGSSNLANDWDQECDNLSFGTGSSASQSGVALDIHAVSTHSGVRQEGKVCRRNAFRESKQQRPILSLHRSLSFKSIIGKSMRSLLSTATSMNYHDHNTDSHLSEKEYQLIEDTLKQHFPCKQSSKSALHDLVLSFERTEAIKGETIISQGDICDEKSYVYVIAEGLCSVIVDGNGVPGPYGILARKSLFGELGVLYSTIRGATVLVKSDEGAVLFRAQGEAFTKCENLLLPSNPRTAVSDGTTAHPEDEHIHEIDEAINQLMGTKHYHGGEIIRQYEPGRLWLWTQWQGTILQHNFYTCLYAMWLSSLLVVVVHTFGQPTWSLGLAPDEKHPWVEHLSMVQKLWVYQMTLTTFILTFFVNQAYSFWNEIMVTTRLVQGRICDFMLLLATSADRNQDGTFTPEAEALIDDVAASVRLFHALFWASTAHRFRPLLTPTGLERMVQRGMMTQKQLNVLEGLNTRDDDKYHACLEWMMVRCWQGMEEGVLKHSNPLSHQLMEKMCQVRAYTATIQDNGKHRMPLAYTHFVQILVDTFIVISPFALYPDLGVYSIHCVGILTLFYTGLLDMAKIFLKPLNSTSVNMGVDLGVLTRESNDSSVHFKESGASMPFENSIKLCDAVTDGSFKYKQSVF